MKYSLETKYGKAHRIGILDRGMVNPEHIDFIKQRDGRYIVVTPKNMLKRYEQALWDQEDWTRVQDVLEVKTRASPAGQ